LEELKDLERIIKNAKKFIKENPNDDLVPFLLEQDLYRRDELLKELESKEND
jgi:hypothetical protein